jgi:peptidoglycan/LPS O-acetylase OafA/YrhL
MRHVVRDRTVAAVRGGVPVDSVARSEPEAGSVRLPYLPGLDGLRALAVVAVLLYHADLSWLPGGFLGVEIFFVISGYLITALLVMEWRKLGRVDLKKFWLRRARRLLPALYLLLAVTLTYAVVFLPGEVAGLRDDVIAAMGYVTNWYLVLGHESYFEAMGRPSLLKHLWSLAVEEQFYLLWPPVLALGLSLGAERFRQRRVLFVALMGAIASGVLMAILYHPEADPSRVYYGTDTRATGLLLGAALAFVWTPWPVTTGEGGYPTTIGGLPLYRRASIWGQLRRRWGWTVPLLVDLAGLGALGALVALCLRLGEYQPLLYRGGLALVGLSTTVVIMACVHPHARLGNYLLGQLPLRWVGVRSYGIYLWHWPIFMITRAQLDVPLEGLPLVGLRLGLTLALADLSYRYVERPIRKGALERAWRGLREARGLRRRELSILWAGAAVPAVVFCAVLGVAVARVQPPDTPSYISTKRLHIEASAATSGKNVAAENAASTEGAPATPPHSATARGEARPIAHPTSDETSARTPRATAKVRGKVTATASSSKAPTGTVTAVGDSAMLGAVYTLRREIPNLTIIDARGSRQAPEAIGVLKVLIVNVTIPDGHSWVPNNKVLADGVRRYPNRAVLVDWYGASVGHPEYFWDGIHLTPQGARAYADLIATVYEKHAR